MNEPEVGAAGLAAVLNAFADRIETVAPFHLTSDPDEPVDLALYDPLGQVTPAATADIERVTAMRLVARVAVFSARISGPTVEHARRAGAVGAVSKWLPAEELVAVLERIVDGHEFLSASPVPLPSASDRWTGADAGLTRRESDVLVLAAQGLTNAEIGQLLFLGPETVKSHMASGLPKLGLRKRLELVRYAAHRWGTLDPP